MSYSLLYHNLNNIYYKKYITLIKKFIIYLAISIILIYKDYI